MRERFVALLPLTHNVDFGHDQILAGVSGLFPSLTSKLGVVRAGGFAEGGEGVPCLLAVGPNIISVHLHPGLPNLGTSEALDEVCPAWFGLRANHPKAHSHVVVRSEQEVSHPAEALAAAAAVSMVAAALISIVPVEEIIWKTGQVSIEPQAFQRAALRLTSLCLRLTPSCLRLAGASLRLAGPSLRLAGHLRLVAALWRAALAVTLAFLLATTGLLRAAAAL